MTEFYFIRHAETEMNIQPHLIGGRSNHTKLTPRGERQAAAFGSWLADAPLRPDVIYVSPALRTRETARLIVEHADYHETPLHIDERLQELSQGKKEGAHRAQTYTDDVQRLIKQDPFGYKFEDGESIRDVMHRMHTTLQELRDRHPDETVFIISHGFSIRSLVGHIEQHSHDDIVFGMRVPNVSLTHISMTNHATVVHKMGEDSANVESIS